MISDNFLQLMTPRGDYYQCLEQESLWVEIGSRFEDYQNRISRMAPQIPKIIHQIWLGSPLPERYRRWSQKWQELHPGWEYHLWDEAAIQKIGIKNNEAFLKTKNFGAKSDIARYAILEKMGGFYADTDFEPVRSLEELLPCTFVSGIVYEKKPETNNAFFGSIPGHLILKAMVAGTEKPLAWNDGGTVMDYSGPWAFSRAVFQFLRDDPTCVVLPHAYLYPYPNSPLKAGVPLLPAENYIRAETLALHHWDKGWLVKVTLREKVLRKIYGLIKKVKALLGKGDTRQ